uniref:Ig-like domain-containing protein n=1 Tax=Panagrolaimus superbus TaxID=310955 RepID=A0A914YGH6_9BILA
MKYQGIIKCLVEVENNTLITRETDFKVFNETYNYDAAVFTPIERKQGTPVSFRCETYDILGETPEMAEWSLNGRPIERTENIKISRSIDYGIGHSDLIIAIAEAENEGLYTCIISNEQHERIQQLLLQVDITTNETITNLKVSTDHKTSCIQLEFDLPPSTDLSWAHFTPFFVVVHERNSTESLNSFPLMAKCNKQLHCKMEICQASGILEEATEYIFRVSMVLSGSGTVITPLSKPAIATTW